MAKSEKRPSPLKKGTISNYSAKTSTPVQETQKLPFLPPAQQPPVDKGPIYPFKVSPYPSSPTNRNTNTKGGKGFGNGKGKGNNFGRGKGKGNTSPRPVHNVEEETEDLTVE